MLRQRPNLAPRGVLMHGCQFYVANGPFELCKIYNRMSSTDFTDVTLVNEDIG